MPLRDHFRPPLDDLAPWEGMHGGWPMVMVLALNRTLPPDYVAAPRVHHGAHVEIDVAAYESADAGPAGAGGGGVATAAWAPATPTLALDTDLPDADEYEVLVYSARGGRRLVAAVELVSPSNKDRPGHRRAFVAKCAALLRARVAVVIVDVVTARPFNLYRDLMAFVDHPVAGPAGEPLYAAAARTVPKRGTGWRLEAWEHPLAVGEPLPTLPLWLDDDLAVPLELEPTYEETCRALRIP